MGGWVDGWGSKDSADLIDLCRCCCFVVVVVVGTVVYILMMIIDVLMEYRSDPYYPSREASTSPTLSALYHQQDTCRGLTFWRRKKKKHHSGVLRNFSDLLIAGYYYQIPVARSRTSYLLLVVGCWLFIFVFFPNVVIILYVLPACAVQLRVFLLLGFAWFSNYFWRLRGTMTDIRFGFGCSTMW